MASKSQKGGKSPLSALSARIGNTRTAAFAGSVRLPTKFPTRVAIATPGFEDIADLLVKFRTGSINNTIPANVMNKAVQGIGAGIRDNFEKKKGPDGPWEPLSPSTATFRARQGYAPGSQDLVRGGSLKKAIDQLELLAAASNESGSYKKYTGTIKPTAAVKKAARTRKDGTRAKPNEKLDERYKSPPVTVDIQYSGTSVGKKQVTKFAKVTITGESVKLNNGYSFPIKGGTRTVPARPFWYVSTYGINEAEKLIRDYLAGHMTKEVRPMIANTLKNKNYLHQLGTQENMSLIAMRSMSAQQRKQAFVELFTAGLRARGLITEKGSPTSMGWRTSKRIGQVTEPEDLLRVAGTISLRRDIAEGTFLHKTRDPIEHYLTAMTGEVIHRYFYIDKKGKTVEVKIDLADTDKRKKAVSDYMKRVKAGLVVTTGKDSELTSLEKIIRRVDEERREARRKAGFANTRRDKGDYHETLDESFFTQLKVETMKARMKEMRARRERGGTLEGDKRSIRYLERHEIASYYNFRIVPWTMATSRGPKWAGQGSIRKSTIDESLELIMGRAKTEENEMLAIALGSTGRDFGDAIIAIRLAIQQQRLELEAQAKGNRELLKQIDDIPDELKYDAYFQPDNEVIALRGSGFEFTKEGTFSSRATRHNMATRMIDFVPKETRPAVTRVIQELFGHWDMEWTRLYTRYGGRPGNYHDTLENKYGQTVEASTLRKAGTAEFSAWEIERNRLVWMRRTLRVMEYFAQRAWEEMYYRSVEIRIKHEMGMYYESLDFTKSDTELHPYATQANRMLEDILAQIRKEEDQRDEYWSRLAGGEKLYGPRFLSKRRELGWLMNYDDFSNVFWNGYITDGIPENKKQLMLGPDGLGIDVRATTPVEGRAYREVNGRWRSVNRSQANWLQFIDGQTRWGLNKDQAIAAGLINKRGELIEADVPVHIMAAALVKEAAKSWGTEAQKHIMASHQWLLINENDLFREEQKDEKGQLARTGKVIGIKRGKYKAGGREQRKSWWAGYARAAAKNPQFFTRSDYDIVPFGSSRMRQEAAASELSIRRKLYFDVYYDIINRYGFLVNEEFYDDPRKLLRSKGLGAYRVESYLYGRSARGKIKEVLPAAYEQVKVIWGRDASGRLIANYTLEQLGELISQQKLTPTQSRIAYQVLVALYQAKEAEAAEAADKIRQGK